MRVQRLVMLSLALWLAPATPVGALLVLPIFPTVPPQPFSLVICADGASVIFPGPPPHHMFPGTPGHTFCQQHGGIANVTDPTVQSAIEEIASCDTDSSFGFGQDQGGGSYRSLTPAELDAFVQQARQQGQAELTGYELLSLRVDGNELLANPVSGLDRHPLSALFSNEDEDGTAVGGRTEASWCSVREVPLPPATAPLLLGALALLGGGASGALARRRARRT